MRIALFCIIVIAIATNSLCAQTWKAYNDSAVVYRKQGGFDKALDFFMQAKKSLPIDSVHSETVFKIDTAIGNIYYLRKGQYATAELYYLEARQIIEKRNENKSPAFAAVASLLGQVNYKQIRYDTAEASYFEVSL